MRQVAAILTLGALAVAVAYVGSRLSPDAIGMAVGVLFGVVAGVPVALLVLLAQRRGDRQPPLSTEIDPRLRGQAGYLNAQQGGYQPPVIVLAGPALAPYQQAPTVDSYGNAVHAPGQRALMGPAPAETGRKFRMVGEQDEWIDEF
jgi:hypothetical protein